MAQEAGVDSEVPEAEVVLEDPAAEVEAAGAAVEEARAGEAGVAVAEVRPRIAAEHLMANSIVSETGAARNSLP